MVKNSKRGKGAGHKNLRDAAKARRGQMLMSLDDLYSTKEAAELLGCAVVTLRGYVRSKRIVPIEIGKRPGAYAHTFVFTRRMLARFAKGIEPARPITREKKQVFSTASAAEYLGISIESVKQAFHVRKKLRGKTVGVDTVYVLSDLSAYQRREPAKSTEHYRAVFTAEQIHKMRELHKSGAGATEIKNELGLDADLSSVWRVIHGQRHKNI